MWRVLRNIYDSVESSVLIDDRRTRFFNIDVGLRQGCLLSPILFALYINGLAEEIKKVNLGVQFIKHTDNRLGVLMFADDISLIAGDKEKLEHLMKITFEYSRKWRFTFNYEKCAVVVFDNNVKSRPIQLGNCTQVCNCGYHWKLGDKLIQQVNSYKYLGIELDPVLSFKEFKQRIREKARKNMSKIWGLGMIRCFIGKG